MDKKKLNIKKINLCLNINRFKIYLMFIKWICVL